MQAKKMYIGETVGLYIHKKNNFTHTQIPDHCFLKSSWEKRQGGTCSFRIHHKMFKHLQGKVTKI